jgi:hypothetical protein
MDRKSDKRSKNQQESSVVIGNQSTFLRYRCRTINRGEIWHNQFIPFRSAEPRIASSMTLSTKLWQLSCGTVLQDWKQSGWQESKLPRQPAKFPYRFALVGTNLLDLPRAYRKKRLGRGAFFLSLTQRVSVYTFPASSHRAFCQIHGVPAISMDDALYRQIHSRPPIYFLIIATSLNWQSREILSISLSSPKQGV